MKILIVVKHSKFEWEQKQLKLSADELESKLIKEGANVPVILESHDAQLNNRRHILSALKGIVGAEVDLIMMDELGYSKINHDIVIAFGGDNSYTYVSHFIKDTIILGVNSDPDRSVGCLTRWSVNSLSNARRLAHIIRSKSYSVEEWTRLGATINGEPIPLATSEYFFGERHRNKMSRHILEFDGKSYEQKCSGIIVSTGAGSTGWYNSAHVYYMGFDPTEHKASFVITEPYNTNDPASNSGTIKEGQNIILRSLNDDEGLVSVDSWDELKFCRGSVAEIYLDKPLNVLNPSPQVPE